MQQHDAALTARDDDGADFHFINWSGLLETARTVWPHRKAGRKLYWVFVGVAAAAFALCVSALQR